jgi:hypothetical protein
MFRFTIRDVLLLTALIAACAGWFVDHATQERRIERERQANIEAAAKVQVEWLKRYRGEIPSAAGP